MTVLIYSNPTEYTIPTVNLIHYGSAFWSNSINPLHVNQIKTSPLTGRTDDWIHFFFPPLSSFSLLGVSSPWGEDTVITCIGYPEGKLVTSTSFQQEMCVSNGDGLQPRCYSCLEPRGKKQSSFTEWVTDNDSLILFFMQVPHWLIFLGETVWNPMPFWIQYSKFKAVFALDLWVWYLTSPLS